MKDLRHRLSRSKRDSEKKRARPQFFLDAPLPPFGKQVPPGGRRKPVGLRCVNHSRIDVSIEIIEHGLTVAEWLHRWKPDAHVEDIRGILGQMLFTGEEGAKPTKALSGGEQARLVFCKLILTKPNILIFDEPTNHLDLESINALNIALAKYEGTVLLVTHDHDLIDEVATRLWHFDTNGIEDFQGPYEEWKGKHS